jgi:drug/metabolite transporter (DMT)-like permease
MDRRRSVMLLLVCVLLWSTSGLFIKISTLNPIALAGGRSAITALVLLAYIRRPHFSWSRAQIGGAICMAATFFLFITATRLTSAANAILLQYTAPLYVILFSGWYLGEKPHRYDWWTMGAIVVGMLLFFGDQLTTRGLIGNFLAMASAVTMAWMTLFLRRERSGSAETILLGNTLTAVIGVPFLFAATVTPVDWGILLFMGIFQLGIPFILYSVAIQQLEAVETILISTLEPILNPIWVFMVVGERPGPMAMLGGLIVVGAVTVRALIASGFGQSREVPVPVQTGD